MSAAIEQLGRGGGVHVRQLSFARAGDRHAGHRHRVNHVTLIHRGAVRCEVAGHDPVEAAAGQWLTIDKDTHHTFTALADGTVYFCIFSLHDENGAIDAPQDDAVLGQCFGCPAACSP